MHCRLVTTILALATGVSFSQTGDIAPIDPAQLLQALKALREQNETGVRARRNNAYQQISAAAQSGEKAAAFWKEAVKAVQFEGAAKEGSQIRDWREGDGEALNEKLGQNAVRLHLQWLALSLQHSAGAETRQLLPAVLEYTKQLQANEEAAKHFDEQLDKAKDRKAVSAARREEVREDGVVKRVHDQILRMPVNNSPVSRWLQLGDLLGGTGKRVKTGENASWEMNPGNLDGIFNNIVLPEFRATKDARLLDYWEMVLRRETERAAEKKLDVEQRDWAQVKKPRLLWARAQDVMLLGYKNRALVEMFNIIKATPQHPDATSWITTLETALAPTTSAPAPAPGTVPPPQPVPAATVLPANS